MRICIHVCTFHQSKIRHKLQGSLQNFNLPHFIVSSAWTYQTTNHSPKLIHWEQLLVLVQFYIQDFKKL